LYNVGFWVERETELRFKDMKGNWDGMRDTQRTRESEKDTGRVNQYCGRLRTAPGVLIMTPMTSRISDSTGSLFSVGMT